MKTLWTKNPIWAVAIVGALIFLPNLDVLYINIMEARNFITAREMLSDGNWLLTTMDGQARYQKPPLPTWFAALFGAGFGIDKVWALRIPSAISAIVMVIYMFKLSLRLKLSTAVSSLTSLVLATSFYMIFAGRNGTWDIFAHSFMVMGIYHLFIFLTIDEKQLKNGILAGSFIGLSFMSKGPVSHYALLLPFLIAFAIAYGKQIRFSRTKGLIMGLLLVVAVLLSSWWAYYIYLFDGETASRIAQKEAANWTNYNVRPFYYYWSFFTQSGLWTVLAFVGLLYPYLKKKVPHKKPYLFAWCWTIASVVLLSLIPEKKSRYLLPVLIPMSLTTAFYVSYLIENFRQMANVWERIPAYLHFGILSIVGLGFPLGAYLFFGERLEGHYLRYALLSLVLFGIGIVILKGLIKKELETSTMASVALIIAVMSIGFPLSNLLLDNPNRSSLYDLERVEAEKNIKVYNLNGLSPEQTWQYGKKTNRIITQDTIILPNEKRFGVLTQFNDKRLLSATFPDHSLKFIKTFDFNVLDSTKRGHKPRLKSDYYILTKK